MPGYAGQVGQLMQRHALDGFLTYVADCHISEYVGPEDQRLKQLTGFTGSNGVGITCKESALITDSRYFIQAAKESSYPLVHDTVSELLVKRGLKRVGLDTRTISSTGFRALQKAVGEHSIDLVGVTEIECPARATSQLIDLESIVLSDFVDDSLQINGKAYGPKAREYLGSIGFTDLKHGVTGSSYKDKLRTVREIAGDGACLFTELDTIAWLLNLRASDIEYNPVFYSYMIVTSDDAQLFTNHSVDREGVTVQPYTAFESALNSIKSRKVLVSGDCNQFIFAQLENAEVTDAIRRLQATKNQTELAGMALSYFFDGIALTNLFGWMAKNERYTEEDVANKLHEYKMAFKGYVGPSFETISSTDTNSAIVHHSSSDRPVDKSRVFLLDSGSHYFFGTTDTTRTVHMPGWESGAPADYISSIVHDNTLVFRGHFGAMIKKYELGSSYTDMDALARSFLKEEKKDFGHATGHGVGHFLCVHEDPPCLAPAWDRAKLADAQVFSIEPGYYLEGEYGIRIENLVFSRARGDSVDLVNITMVPYQLSLLDQKLLSDDERRELNIFSKKCRWLLEDFVTPDGLEYLLENTREI
ncbi:Xaa-Pro aminopeptidase [Pancytospora philotis]|nr:Xaa-Pro aminopeptidase [Pancytospora philotis]